MGQGLVLAFDKSASTYELSTPQPFDTSSSETVDNNIRVVSVLSREISNFLRHLPYDSVPSLLSLQGQAHGVLGEAALEVPQQAAVANASHDGYDADLYNSQAQVARTVGASCANGKCCRQ
eukprot:gene19818-21757_t